jgi:hypothetical protein
MSIVVLFIFCGTGVWTQHLILVTQVLYHLNNSDNNKCLLSKQNHEWMKIWFLLKTNRLEFFFFWDRVWLSSPDSPWTHDPLTSASWVLRLQVYATKPANNSFFFFSTGAWTQVLHLEPLHQSYFCEEFFWDRFSQHYLPRLAILLISASWVTRIIGMSYQYLALSFFW